MIEQDFLSRLGFKANPFSSTNAGDEPELSRYFVPPPYYASVLGDPKHPNSAVVLAPRGGGKTAQRIMIEHASKANPTFLCITYDTFELGKGNLNSLDLNYHLNNLCKLLTIAALSEISDNEEASKSLEKTEKDLLKHQINKFLGNISASEYENSIKSLKNIGEKANDAWNKYGGVIASLINSAIQYLGAGKVDLKSQNKASNQEDDSPRYHFKKLVKVIQKLGYESTYILVDRIDELEETTGNSESTFKLIKSLILDLNTLETEGVAFKFFLWDQIEEHYKEAGARLDRVPVHRLRWHVEELEKMLSERLKSYSNDTISSLNQVYESNDELDIQKLVCWLAFGSPRDMIRICQSMISEETRMSNESKFISSTSLWSAIKRFSDTRADELFGKYIPDLRRIGGVTFTINHIANDIFRVSNQAARAKVQNWLKTGAVSKIGDLPNHGNRPLHLFAISDPRLTIALRPQQESELILGNWIMLCRSCGALCVSDRETVKCPECFDEANLESCKSLLQACEIGA